MPRIRVGDVFSLPIDESRVGYGQVVSRWGDSGGHYYFLIFGGAHEVSESPDIDQIVREPPALLALSLDALLVHDHWKVVDHREVVDAAIPWPTYKEGAAPAGAFDVVDHAGQIRRRATTKEIADLPFRKVVAPIRLEKALKSLHGIGPWLDDYGELRLSS